MNNSKPDIEIIEIDPARMASGTWCHDREKRFGEGDIAAAYSADSIGMHCRIRKPFHFRGNLWTCVGYGGCATSLNATAYRLVDPAVFDDEIMTYSQRVRNAEAARNDPRGFYHGMIVQHGSKTYVICGPEIRLIPGKVEQPDLFS